MTETEIRAVIVGAENSVFVARTAEQLRRHGIYTKILDPYKDTPAGGGRVTKIHRLLLRLVRTARAARAIERDSTALILSLSIDIFWLVPMLKLRVARVVGVAFGSDILRRVQSRDFWLRIGLKRLDGIAATNDNVMAAMLAHFPFLYQKERRIIHFGLPVFDEINNLIARDVTPADARRTLGYNPERKLISLGYSASLGQRQLELIQEFARQVSALDGYDFVVPVQYGSPSVVEAVKEACHRANLEVGEQRFRPLTLFHDPVTAAVMRRATNILVNHSISDSFSGTVQEVVYAGNLVLAADHLPYRQMPGFGTAIRSYSTLDEALKLLRREALREWGCSAREAEATNREALSATSSWEAVLPEWRALLTEVGRKS